MNSKMDSNSVVQLLGCVGKAIAQKMPEIIGTVPVYGKPLCKALEALKQGIDDYNNKKISAEEYDRIKSGFYDAAKEEALNAQPPVFMDCVIFRCKPGCTLPAARQDMLADIFEGEREDESGEISSFISYYIGDMVKKNDTYFIGDDYVSLNFQDYDEFDYDEEALCRFQQALNEFAGRDIFDYFVASGHDESNSDMW